jgi:hypothetical protein
MQPECRIVEVSDIFRRLQQRQYLSEFPHMLRIDAAPVVVLEQPFQNFVPKTLDRYRGHPLRGRM